MAAMTQNDRVLRLLRIRGEYGTTVNDWDRGEGVPAVDGGARMTRLAARITDLKNAGHPVEPVEKRGGFTVYALVGSPAPRERPEVAASAYKAPAFVIDTTDGPVRIELEVLNPGWTLTSRGYERTTIVGGGAPSSLADAAPAGSGVALDGPPPPAPSQDDERNAA